MTRILSLSAGPYDGHPERLMLESMARCGATHVEPAFIVGYTEPFHESIFSKANSVKWQAWLADAGIRCHAMSLHMDLGENGADNVFLKRMDFARELGACVVNTNAAARSKARQFMINIDVLARHAYDIGLQIGLENPGDGSDNVINTAEDAAALLGEIDNSSVGLNYDAGNTVSHRRDLDPVQDALRAMPLCVHTHIKDVSIKPDGFYFVQLGEGDVGCGSILAAVAKTNLNLSIEMPLRFHRLPDAKPVRGLECVPISIIEKKLTRALSYVKTQLESSDNIPG